MKTLMRSKSNRQISGVCGGLGEYLGIDPTIIRLIWVVAALAGGSGVLLYIAAACIIPEETGEYNDESAFKD